MDSIPSISNDPPKYTSMVISDDLEDVLEVLEAKVYDKMAKILLLKDVKDR